jgi:hypothetical protein
MKLDAHKKALVVALVLTLLALLYLPSSYGYGDWRYHEHILVTDMSLRLVHWPTLAVELAVIWVGFFIAKIVTKKEGSPPPSPRV